MLEALILAVLLAGRLVVSLPAAQWLDEVEQWQHNGRQKRQEVDPVTAAAEHTEVEGDELSPESGRESGSGAAEGGEDASGADGSGDEIDIIYGIEDEISSGDVKSDGKKEMEGDDGSGSADESLEGSIIAEPVTDAEEHTEAEGEEQSPDTERERGPEAIEDGEVGSGAGDVGSIAREGMEGVDVSGGGAGESSGGSDGVHEEDEMEAEIDTEGDTAFVEESEDAKGSETEGSGNSEGSGYLQINQEFQSGNTEEDTAFVEKDSAVFEVGIQDLEEAVQDEDGEHSMFTNATVFGSGREDGDGEEGHLVSSPEGIGSGVNQGRSY